MARWFRSMFVFPVGPLFRLRVSHHLDHAPFPHPAHQTGRADFPHPAFGQGWKGETERLVTQGVDREKAGKPSKSQIDAAFADLTPETGKDWLAFYRRRAG